MSSQLDGFTSLVLEVNGERRPVVFPTHHTLLEVLREECGLTGTKHGCELGECGTCAVLVDGRPVLSCLILTAEMEGKSIETVEGLAEGNKLHPLQAALADLGAAQCGYCTPGILMAAKALLAERPDAERRDIEQALAGNLCRCTGYHKIVEGIEWAAAKMRGEDVEPPHHVLYGELEPASVSEPRSPGSPRSARSADSPVSPVSENSPLSTSPAEPEGNAHG